MRTVITLCLWSVAFLVGAVELQTSGIEVTGKASVSATPDKFTLTLSIVERGASATKTKLLVDHKSDQVIAAATALSIKLTDIQSAHVYLQPIYQEPTVKLAGVETNQTLATENRGKVQLDVTNNADDQYRPVAFEVSRQMTISLNELSIYDQLLERLVKVGVSHISSLQMSISNADSYYQKALAQAIFSAKQKALRIAGQAGVKLGRLTYLKEISYGVPSQRMMASEMAMYHPSLPGTEEVSAQVIAIYAITP